MNVSKCPKCTSKQGFFHILLINNVDEKKCKECGCPLTFSFTHSMLLLMSSVALMVLVLYSCDSKSIALMIESL